MKNELYFINLTNFFFAVRSIAKTSNHRAREFVKESIADHLYYNSKWSNHFGQFALADHHFPDIRSSEITDVINEMTKMSRVVDNIVGRNLNEHWGVFKIHEVRSHDDECILAVEEIADYRIEKYHEDYRDELSESNSMRGSAHHRRHLYRKEAMAKRKDNTIPRIPPVSTRSNTWKLTTTQLSQPETVRHCESYTAKTIKRNKEREKQDDKALSNSDINTRSSQRRI